ncbi:Olfactory receptor 7A10 [Sciurus carolinensis]|uniref:Olfactory receptor n=1 Tax=Sciurus carolinensis TaxID=30640 RepID=A0AA41SSK8_SCICA|nr:Olfactory receptor 7A10 [Sciurus carolinensis]
MYFFLSNLSFVNICFTSTSIPKMLLNIQTKSKAITYTGCITQMCFFMVFIELDNFLLTVMAYDRYVAICHPLHYTAIMNSQLCGLLVLVSWILSLLHALLESLMVLQLSFCTNLEIPHFFCELNQVVQLACSDTFLNDMVMYIASVLLAGGPIAGILYSYSRIVSSICRGTADPILAWFATSRTSVRNLALSRGNLVCNKQLTRTSTLALRQGSLVCNIKDFNAELGAEPGQPGRRNATSGAETRERTRNERGTLGRKQTSSNYLGGPLAGILYSYSKIVPSILAISSAQGSPNSSATASVMYTVVTPMLNPFIYSLRNKDANRVLRRLFGRK